MVIYFDTNALLDMSQLKCGVTREQVCRLVTFVAGGSREVLMSVCQIEELLSPLVSPCPNVLLSTLQADLRFVRDIARHGRFIEHPWGILMSDMQRCLAGQEPVSHAVPPHEAFECIENVLGLRRVGDLHSRMEVFRQSCARDDGYKKFYNEWRDDFVQRYKQEIGSIRGKDRPSEEELWHEVTAYLVRDSAVRCGLANTVDDVQLSSLLSLRSVRLGIGYVGSYVYDLFFNGRDAKGSDFLDHQHAICASLADIFVTSDKRLSDILRRIPDKGTLVLLLPHFLSGL